MDATVSPFMTATRLDSFKDEDLRDAMEELIKKQRYMNETVRIGTYFARTHVALGVAAVLLNLTILIVLVIKRRYLFKNVFYMLIFNFALIDCIKGVCLIAYALRMLKLPRATSNQMGIVKLDQYMTFIFRFCNLATILNLLMITLNEFLFIKYPFLYNRWIKRRLALFLICLNWVLCLSFTFGSTLARASGSRVMVPSNYTRSHLIQSDQSSVADSGSEQDLNETNIFWNLAESKNGVEAQYIFAFTIITFCLLCLIVVLICYASFIRVIRAIKLADSRLYLDANRPSDYDITLTLTNSNHRANNGSNGRSGSVEDRKMKGQLLRRNKYAIVIGSVILVYTTYLITYSTIQVFQYMHLSGGRTAAGHRQSDDGKYRTSHVIRWSLQILVGLHSACQPLCYFRMREFRRFVTSVICCAFKKRGVLDRDYYTMSFGADHLAPGGRSGSIAMANNRRSSAFGQTSRCSTSSPPGSSHAVSGKRRLSSEGSLQLPLFNRCRPGEKRRLPKNFLIKAVMMKRKNDAEDLDEKKEEDEEAEQVVATTNVPAPTLTDKLYSVWHRDQHQQQKSEPKWVSKKIDTSTSSPLLNNSPKPQGTPVKESFDTAKSDFSIRQQKHIELNGNRNLVNGPDSGVTATPKQCPVVFCNIEEL